VRLVRDPGINEGTLDNWANADNRRWGWARARTRAQPPARRYGYPGPGSTRGAAGRYRRW